MKWELKIPTEDDKRKNENMGQVKQQMNASSFERPILKAQEKKPDRLTSKK